MFNMRARLLNETQSTDSNQSTQTMQETGDIISDTKITDQCISISTDIVPLRADNKAAERSRLYRERHKEEINKRRRDTRQCKKRSHQIQSLFDIQNINEIHSTTNACINKLSSNSQTKSQRRYYERHKEEINKRKRDRRLKQRTSHIIPATSAERNRIYRERNKQKINERRRDSRQRQHVQRIDTECDINSNPFEQITNASLNQQNPYSSNDNITQEIAQNSTSSQEEHNTQYFEDTHYDKFETSTAAFQTIEAPKGRWESLRGQYRKYLGKVKKCSQKGIKISKWRYLDQMQFINDHINVEIPQLPFTDEETSVENTLYGDRGPSNVPTDSNTEDQVMSEMNDNDLIEQINDSIQTSAIILGTRKRKIGATSVKDNTSGVKYLLENQQEHTKHPLDHFFKLMAATVKNFSLTDQYLVKTTVFNLVSKLEEKYLKQLEPTSNARNTKQSSIPTSIVKNPSHSETCTMSDDNLNTYTPSPSYATFPPSPTYTPSTPQYATVKVEYQSNDES